jgi:hypothetical protein
VLLHLAHLCGQLQLCQENLNRGPEDKNAHGAACHLLERVAASYAKLDPYLRGRISNPACLNACVRLLYQVLLFAAWLHPLCLGGAVNEAWGLAASLASTLCHILSNPATQQPSTIWGPRLRTALQDSPPLLNRPRECLYPFPPSLTQGLACLPPTQQQEQQQQTTYCLCNVHMQLWQQRGPLPCTHHSSRVRCPIAHLADGRDKHICSRISMHP